MGKLMKGGVSYGGVADIDISNEPVVLTVTEIPSNPHDGMTVLYNVDDNSGFIKGQIYQYSETDEEWVEINTSSIPIADVSALFD